MARCLIKIKDKYFEWSTIVDAPVTYGMTEEELEKYIERQYGKIGLNKLPHRLERVEETGTSAYWCDLKSIITPNRAGGSEEELTKEEIYNKYTD